MPGKRKKTGKDKEKITRVTHNMFYHEFMSRRDVAADTIKNFLSSDLARITDLRTLKLDKDHYVSDEFKERYSDITYTAKIRGKDAYFYFLFEHKSYNDKSALFQIYQYRNCIWDNYRNQNPKATILPIVIPVLFYHGREKWRYGTEFGNMFQDIPELKKYITNFTVELVDMSRIPDQKIQGCLLTQLCFLAVKYIKRPDFLEKGFPELIRIINSFPERNKVKRLHYILQYLFYNIDEKKHDDITEKVKQDLDIGGEEMRTIADKLLDEGRSEGIEQGCEKTAVNMIKKGMDDATIREITGLSLKRIKELKTGKR